MVQLDPGRSIDESRKRDAERRAEQRKREGHRNRQDPGRSWWREDALRWSCAP